MEIINKDDYLDILRYLNAKNINDSQKIKDEFFEMITTNYEFLPKYIKELSVFNDIRIIFDTIKEVL